MSENVKNMIGKVFGDIASAMETGAFGERVRVGLTLLGSEHGVENTLKAAEIAQKNNPNIQVVLIGPKVDTELELHEVVTEEDQHTKMESLLGSKDISSVVTMHYNFPIGVSTVGRVITPALAKQMYIATTTGTSSAHRVEGMVKNAIHGIITAKSMGIEKPTVGILNVDGARAVERALNELKENGYDIEFSESMRSDGGCVMRGNDLLTGTPDIMVTDSLTGNILMKMFSSYTTGGSIEVLGYGYGPGVGAGQDKTVLIVSRASGPEVIANAIQYAGDLARGKISEVTNSEFKSAEKAKLKTILEGITKKESKSDDSGSEEVEAPPKEVVTGSISGVDIMDLEDAVQALWKNSIYAESGMGCTGPIVMVNEGKVDKATDVLSKEGYIQ